MPQVGVLWTTEVFLGGKTEIFNLDLEDLYGVRFSFGPGRRSLYNWCLVEKTSGAKMQKRLKQTTYQQPPTPDFFFFLLLIIIIIILLCYYNIPTTTDFIYLLSSSRLVPTLSSKITFSLPCTSIQEKTGCIQELQT